MSKPTIKDLQAELHSLRARHLVTQGSNDRLLNEVKRLKGSPKVQEQLNMANATVAELMNEVETLNKRLTDANTDKMKYFNRLGELAAENEKLQKELIDIDGIKQQFVNADIYAKEISIENQKLKSDYAELESKYYNVYTDYSNINAENHALKAEIERTNRHINLAENQLHKEQQPLVVNHYHNCTINK